MAVSKTQGWIRQSGIIIQNLERKYPDAAVCKKHFGCEFKYLMIKNPVIIKEKKDISRRIFDSYVSGGRTSNIPPHSYYRDIRMVYLNTIRRVIL